MNWENQSEAECASGMDAALAAEKTQLPPVRVQAVVLPDDPAFEHHGLCEGVHVDCPTRGWSCARPVVWDDAENVVTVYCFGCRSTHNVE